ncbi:MAG TPA: hypothetical protein VGM90_37855 [Kofleriaceae bacterium]|jgi:hypothetical protein
MVTHHAAEFVRRLTWDEICERYPDQWVVLADIAHFSRTDFAFTDAEIVAAFSERKAASPTMKELYATRRQSVGCFFTGKLIKGDVDPLWHSR